MSKIILKVGQNLIFIKGYDFRVLEGKQKNKFCHNLLKKFDKGDQGFVIGKCMEDPGYLNVYFPKQDCTASLGMVEWSIFDLKTPNYNQYWAKLNE